MPLYEFKCQSCGAEFEHIASFSECDTIAKEMQCSCGGDVKKLLSIPAFTPERWGDGTGKYGVNGFKCVQSGMRFQNKREQFKWMEKNGKVFWCYSRGWSTVVREPKKLEGAYKQLKKNGEE